MLTAFICMLSASHVNAPLKINADAIQIKVSSTTQTENSERLAADLAAEAQKWAARYVEVHKTTGDVSKIELQIRMPFALPAGVNGREVQFKRSQFLSANLHVTADQGGKDIPFTLSYRDGEWTHDARARKANPMDTVLRAYVRKAVDKGLDLALAH